MDYLYRHENLVSQADMLDFAERYVHPVTFVGSSLFTDTEKTMDLKATWRMLSEFGGLPVPAYVHSLDTEAKIGTLPNFEEKQIEKLFVKEKLPLYERMAYMIGNAPTNDQIIEFIFNREAWLISHIHTRFEIMRMEALGTGKITANENNTKWEYDYKLPKGNFKPINGWDKPNADILGDITAIQDYAATKGKTIVKAILSSKMLGYMLKNTAILGYLAAAQVVPSRQNVLNWISGNFGITFVVDDEVYLENTEQADKAHRFFPEDTITWLTTTGAVGRGLRGYTPEELQLRNTPMRENMGITITVKEEWDPAITWMKGSAVYVPVLSDVNGIFISKHTA